MNQDGMSSDEVHKNSMCKDGRCPETTPSDNEAAKPTVPPSNPR
jgi:hypothetical protein